MNKRHALISPQGCKRRRTLELAREYRSIGTQCYVLPNGATTSAEAIRDYVAHKVRAGGPQLADSVDGSADGDAHGSTQDQQSRSGGDAVASGSGGPRGKRVFFEFHRMSSYRWATTIRKQSITCKSLACAVP